MFLCDIVERFLFLLPLLNDDFFYVVVLIPFLGVVERTWLQSSVVRGDSFMVVVPMSFFAAVECAFSLLLELLSMGNLLHGSVWLFRCIPRCRTHRDVAEHASTVNLFQAA
jgi:hypothetical protein